ncbi:MAG: 2Fe-2S iron-sulfur cluster-binding protein [Planctomycetota bacterium]|jgi:NADPH-dependent glutamate synthase beta subunit-like oxidoreductase/ferredoxin
MITLTIDNMQLQASEGSTILDAAEKNGIHIPTLCCLKTLKPSVSCMVCLVRVEGLRSLVPACGSKAADKMVVTTQSDEIHAARIAAIELLLSDHVGDCLGPCMIGCPAKMDIPLMIRQIATGDFKAAIKTVKRDIPLPAILGRVCSAPCEKVCRRAQSDAAVSICLLKRFVADLDLASSTPFQPQCAEPTGKKVAIMGAGPAGLSAAYYLRQQGIDCMIYDKNEKPGGTLRYGDVDRSILPETLIDQEITQLLSIGLQFKGNTELGERAALEELKTQYDALLLTVGEKWEDAGIDWEVDSADGKIKVNRTDYATSISGIFAAGGCIGSRNLFIRRIADGKEAARSIKSALLGDGNCPGSGYNHRLGLLDPDELAVMMKQVTDSARIVSDSMGSGLTEAQAKQEAARCMHCDCRKSVDCRLRQRAAELNARQRTWQGEKKRFRQITEHEKIIFEPGKCIQCGRCIQTAQIEGEPFGLSFQGRGFDAEVVVPLDKSFVFALTKAASKCVEICPTGALAIKD